MKRNYWSEVHCYIYLLNVKENFNDWKYYDSFFFKYYCSDFRYFYKNLVCWLRRLFHNRSMKDLYLLFFYINNFLKSEIFKEFLETPSWQNHISASLERRKLSDTVSYSVDYLECKTRLFLFFRKFLATL